MLLARLLLVLLVAPTLRPQQGAWSEIPGNPGAPSWAQGQMAFDRARGRCVSINGSEIWESTGTTWQLAASGPGVGGVLGGFAYDWARGVSVWFGGGLIFVNNSTFEWDGSTWTQIVTAQAPPARGFTAMTYDVARGRMVLFGGFGVGGALADTWEFDGTNWQQRNPPTSPPAMSRHRMAYDIARAEVVLVGSGQTWLFDGTDWRQGAIGLPVMINPALIYDEARDATVLTPSSGTYGAPLSTYEWDGATWTFVPNGPVANHSVNGAYDSVRGYPMIVAGSDIGIDIWRWDGSAWRPATQFGSRPAFPGMAGAYHARSSTIITFGGDLGVFLPPFDETFEYRRATWQRLSPATTPPGRSHAAMATEPSGDVLLTGGRFFGTTGSGTLGDSWRWNGSDWAQLSPATSPSPRSSHGMATDTTRGRVVLFGGQDATSTLLAETWEWDGATWLLRSPVTSPPPRVNPAMTFFASNGKTLLFGGGSQQTGFYDDLWEFDGTNWAPRTLGVRPAPRACGQFTFDPQGGAAVLTGGWEYHFLGANVPVNDSWVWDDVAWTPIATTAPEFAVSGLAVFHDELRSTVYSANDKNYEFAFGSVAATAPFGAGCPGPAGPPLITGLSMPRTGNRQFAIWLTNALAGVVAFVGFDTASTTIALGGGCNALLPAPAFVVTVTDAVGNALVPLAIPNDPSLHGVALFCQALALDPRGAVFNLASLSAGLRIVLS